MVIRAAGDVTVIKAHLLAALASREVGDQRAANQAAERVLARVRHAVPSWASFSPERHPGEKIGDTLVNRRAGSR